MLTFNDQYTLAQRLSSDSDSTNLVMLKSLINIGYHKLQKKLGIYHLEEDYSFTTVTDAISGTSYQDYALPPDFNTLLELYVTVGTTQYPAELIQDIRLWRQMNSTTTQSTSDYVSHCFIKRARVQLWPIPSSANTATMKYISISKDLIQADYTTGTIATLANEGTAVTGTDTEWTSAMVGRYFKIDDDGQWYRISAVGSTTALTLEVPYQGTAISGGTESYTIGEVPKLPPDTHELPVFYALWKYWLFRKDRPEARMYKTDWEDGVNDAVADWANRSASKVIPNRSRARRRLMVNPNYFPEGMS